MRYWGVEWFFAFGCFSSLLLLFPTHGMSVLALLALVGVYGVVFVRDNLRALIPLAPLLVFPALTIASTLWSDAPGTTLRYSIQFTISMVAGVLIARRTPGPALIGAVFAAFLLAGVLSILNPRTEFMDMHGTVVFLGQFGSKNEMAMAASLLALSATAAMLDRRQPLIVRLAAVGGLGLAGVLIAMARSSGATISIIVAGAAYAGVALLSRFGPAVRVLALVTVLLAAVPVGMVVSDMAKSTDTLAVKLGKDTTLTGRTYLWERAGGYIRAKPVLGHGFQAFWRQGNLEAEGLWRYAKVAARKGFNFHNQYVEILVDLGWTGLVVFLATVVASFVALVRRVLISPTPTVGFAFAVFFYLMLRTPMESALLGTFNFVACTLFMACTVGLGGERKA